MRKSCRRLSPRMRMILLWNSLTAMKQSWANGGRVFRVGSGNASALLAPCCAIHGSSSSMKPQCSGLRIRGAHPGSVRTADERAHNFYNRPSAFHSDGGGYNLSAGSGANCGARHTCRTGDSRRPICPLCEVQFRRAEEKVQEHLAKMQESGQSH